VCHGCKHVQLCLLGHLCNIVLLCQQEQQQQGQEQLQTAWHSAILNHSRCNVWCNICSDSAYLPFIAACCRSSSQSCLACHFLLLLQARSMSEEVDTVALAALARSNSRAICVSASFFASASTGSLFCVVVLAGHGSSCQGSCSALYAIQYIHLQLACWQWHRQCRSARW
jgi:hypothetical protein